MTAKGYNAGPGTGKVSRRSLLKGISAAAIVAPGVIAAPNVLRAQGKTLVFWTTQRAPIQVGIYESIWKAFEAENPGYKIVAEYMTEEEYLPKLASALAANAAPSLMSHIPPEFAVNLNDRGLLSPMDDVLNTIGLSDFYENSLELLKDTDRGYYPALAIVNSTTTGSLWYRKDLFQRAGLKPPTTWAEFLAAAKATTRGGIYGNVYAFGKTSMGDKLFLQTLWQAGATVFNPDLSIAFNSPQTIRALEFVKEAIAYSPPSSANYAYTETINVFVQGRVATAPYSGRVMVNVADQNAKMADDISVIPYPHLPESEGGQKIYNGDFQSLVIPKGAPDQAASKAMALWLLKKENYIKFLHAVPGHNLPNIKSIANSAEYKNTPILQKYSAELQTMISATSLSRSLLREGPTHKANVKAGAIMNARVLVETIHDMVIGNFSSKDSAARATDKIAAIMKG